MALTLGTGPFGPQHAGHFNGHWDGPAHTLYWEDFQPRLRAVLAGETVLDSTRAKMLHETGHLATLYVPREDVRSDLLEPTQHHTRCPFKGEASYWSLHSGDRVVDNAVWAYAEPLEEAAWLQGYVAVYPDAIDEWYVEDERVYAHVKDPYHRVDVHPSSRHVVVRHGGQVVAESTQPLLLFETSLPVRYYLPPADVDADLLERSETVSDCPYKGAGQHWHLKLGDTTVEDAAWSLPDPLPEGLRAKDHVCFYPDKVDVEVDGQRLAG